MEVQNYVVRGGVDGDSYGMNARRRRTSTAWDKVESVQLFNRRFDQRGVAVIFAVLMLIVYYVGLYVGLYVGASRPLPAPPIAPSAGAVTV